MTLNSPFKLKDPNDVIDFGIDWTARLSGGDSINTSSWSVSPTGLTIDSNSKTSTTTTVWVSSGTAGVTYQLTNRIITTQARQMDLSLSIKVQER